MRTHKGYKIFIQLLAGIIYFSCSDNDKAIKQESKILNDIFLQIQTDDFRFPVFPPPPPPSKEIGATLSQKDSLLIKNYKDLMARINKNIFVFSIEDSTDLLIDSSKIADYFASIGVNDCFTRYHLEKAVKSELPIVINQIKNTGKFKLIKRSEILSKGFDFRKFINMNLTYYYFGNLIFSKPFLDASGKNGFLLFTRKCGFECDKNWVLLIEKQNDKWILKKKMVL